ncbi:MAG: succinylglutamate desuccinylase/aspartoacylase family protein, partial [Myxococcales bacterium]|nr:succinylglutamate desuccinylase/aspartoacylase family protein [Myxococcales bacterium]
VLAWALACGAAGADSVAEGDFMAEIPSEPALPYPVAETEIAPGSVHRVAIAASESFAGAPVSIPVLVLHGPLAGPTLCLTGGVHGDEINGVEVVRRAVETIDVETLRGTVLAVPIVNLHGFRRGSRYLPDRRDLNRYFPGRVTGSSASRIARAVFDRLITRCDHLLDFHTGSFQRANLPHVRGDLRHAGVRALADGLGGWLVLDHAGSAGTLRRAAGDAGIPALTFEVGGPFRVEPQAVERGLEGVVATLAHLGMQGQTQPGRPEVVDRARWVRVNEGGLLFTLAELGDRVENGELLGVVVDPISNQRSNVHAPRDGQVIGMAWSQGVIPGFAAFHLAFSEANGQPADEDADDAGADLHEPEGIESAEPDDRPE